MAGCIFCINRRKRNLRLPPRALNRTSAQTHVSEMVVEFLLAEPDLEMTVVVGGSNPRLASLEALAERAKRPVRLLKDVTDMPSLMVWADLAVAGAGTTSWEMCMMELPVALCVLASNQEKIAGELARLGVAINLDYVCRIPRRRTEGVLREVIKSEEMRARMSARGRKIVDGRGVERVQAFLWGDPSLRRTAEPDCKSFWEWANESTEPAVSVARRPISWDRHMEWFRSRLVDPQSILYTAVNNQSHPIGMVRYQLDGSHAILSINVGAAFRGKGNARKMLFLATEELFRDSGIVAIDAFVRISNQPSIRLFEGAGFHKLGIETVNGDEAIHYVLDKKVGMNSDESLAD
jgi:UDP-2,4-diacetamido-2,4,6-trideoxy-beta-L-altropyranose hydrolase